MFFRSKQKSTETAQDWLKDSCVYQLFVGRTGQGVKGSGLGRFFDALCGYDWKTLIQRQGFNLVYLLGVFDNRSPIMVTSEKEENLDPKSPDRTPSPFAIFDHHALNPEFGTEKSFNKLVSTIQGYGAKVIVDYVANHTAVNHPWVKDHPDYYVKDPSSPFGLKQEFSGDVLKLDYTNPDLLEEQLKILEKIQTLGVDGIRCDMAHYVPLNFWERAIKEVKSRNPAFAFIAEAYSDSVFSWNTLEDLMRVGFDSTYHEFLYRNIRNVFVNHQPLDYLVDHLNFVLKYENRNRLVHYLANHDDPLFAECAPLQEALMALIIFMPGTAFVYNGQLNGFTRRLQHHRLDLLPDDVSEFHTAPDWFTNLMRVRNEKRPLLASVEHMGGGILRCPAYVNGQLGKLVVNLGDQSATVPAPSDKGLLRGLEPGGLLAPGEAELYPFA